MHMSLFVVVQLALLSKIYLYSFHL